MKELIHSLPPGRLQNGLYIFVILISLLLLSTSSLADYPAFKISSSSGRAQINGDNVVYGTYSEIDIYNLKTHATIKINTQNSDRFPGIDNDILVWAQDSGVYGYRISTGQQFPISLSYGGRAAAKVSGNTVVWLDTRNGGVNNYYNVYGYDISTGNEFAITNHPDSPCTSVKISGNYVVWQDERNIRSSSSDVYGFDLQTKTEFPICTTNGWQGSPGIGNNIVAYGDDRNLTVSIYAYDIKTKTEFLIATGAGMRSDPAVSGNYIVWQDARNGNYDIYGYDIAEKREFPICTATGNQSLPSISGNTVVWTQADGIYGTIIPEPATPPIANAGPNQVAYAWIDGIAEIDLDGSGSYDPDGNELTYLWRWSIDGNNYEANGVSPTIELPVGEHTIELVVYDGFEDSEPNYVDINVIEGIEGSLWITPRTINRQSQQPHIMAMLRLPDGITKDQIDSISALLLYPGEAGSYRQIIFGDSSVRILAYFDRDEVLNSIGEMGPVEVYVVGQLKTGQYFYGSDTIRIIEQVHRLLKSNIKN